MSSVETAVIKAAEKYLAYRIPERGEWLRAKCPFHKLGQEQHPSFSMNLKTGRWWCFTCNTTGSLLTFLRYMEADPKDIDAAATLIKHTSLFKSQVPSKDEKTATQLRKSIRKYDVLPEGTLSMFISPPHEDMLAMGFTKELLRQYSFGYDSKLERITFAHRDHLGRLIGISGRSIYCDVYPKYKWYEAYDLDVPSYKPTNVRTFPYNCEIAYALSDKGEGKFIVVEGFKGALWLIQNGFPNTIALMGTYMTAGQRLIIERMANEIVMWFDNDEAGEEAAARFSQQISRSIRLYKVKIEDPEVNSPDDVLSDYLGQLIETAEPYRRQPKLRRKDERESTRRFGRSTDPKRWGV